MKFHDAIRKHIKVLDGIQKRLRTKDGQYRIENIQNVKLNGKNVKLFKAYKYDKDSHSYVYYGQFEAPEKVSNNSLENYID